MPRRASRTSTLDKAVPFTVRFSAKEWELAWRMSAILYRGVVRDFVARAIVERCIAVGTMKVPGKPVPMPKDTASLDEALAALAAYQDALAKRIEEPKAYFIRPATRVHLVKTLATFPHGVAEPYVAPAYKKPVVGEHDDERPASLALLPLQMEAAKAAAEKTNGGNLTAFVVEAMFAKADELGMRSPRALAPTFAWYPASQLLWLQRNIEEPALAVIDAHAQLAAHRRRRFLPPDSSLGATCERLFVALLSVEVDVRVVRSSS